MGDLLVGRALAGCLISAAFGCSVPALGSGTFTTRDEGDKVYTAKVPVDFESGKTKAVQFDPKQNSKLSRGNYKIETYHNGFKIGEGTRELKKGGLFS